MGRPANTRKQDTHERIVDVAARAIRERGYDGIGVADVMKQAGLTHGGFYAHFESRDALIVEALARAGRDSGELIERALAKGAAAGLSPFRAFVEAYLADALLDALDNGCPVAALACDMPRQSGPVRVASADRVRLLVSAVRSVLPRHARAAAEPVAGMLVGGLQMARTIGDTAEGRALLASVRRTLIDQYDTAGPAGR